MNWVWVGLCNSNDDDLQQGEGSSQAAIELGLYVWFTVQDKTERHLAKVLGTIGKVAVASPTELGIIKYLE